MYTRVFILLSFLGSFSLEAQTFEVQLSTDSLLLGNQVKVQFVLDNIDGDFEAPDLIELNIVSGPNTSSSFQMVNGETNRNTSYSYILNPTETGIYSIPPAYLITKENTLETSPLELRVYPNPDNVIQDHMDYSDSYNFSFGSPLFKRKKKEKPTKKDRKLKRI